MSLFAELRRRNVFRVGIAYLVGAWLLVQVGDVLFDAFEAPDWALRGLVVALAIGLPLFLIGAWALELTPEGIKWESEVDRSQSTTGTTGRKLNNVILALALVAVAYLLFDKFYLQEVVGETPPQNATTAPDVSRQSIAVLPFENRSNRDEDEFFVAGIHDDLLTNLTRISDLKVISRTTVSQYRDTAMSIPDIARELGVAHVMEGAVQRAGETVRINVQLIDAATDEHLWAEIFDRELSADNLFNIQTEISQAIARALASELTQGEADRIADHPTDNLEAYQAYLRGRQALSLNSSDGADRALDAFQQAVELDPHFALGWVGMANAAAQGMHYSDLNLDEAIAIAEAAVDRAMALNDQLGEAYLARSTLIALRDGERSSDRELALQRALELIPGSAEAWFELSRFLDGFDQRIPEALAAARKAEALDPLSTAIRNQVVEVLFAADRYEEAEARLSELIQLDPEFALNYELMSAIKLAQGQFGEALHWRRQAQARDPGNILFTSDEVMLLTTMDFEEEYERLVERVDRLDPNSSTTAFVESMIALRQQDYDAALEAVDVFIQALGDNRPYAHSFRGLVLSLKGDDEAAISAIERTMPQMPPDEILVNRVTRDPRRACQMAWLFGRGRDAALGESMARAALEWMDGELTPSRRQHLQLNMGVCLLILGDSEAALARVQAAVADKALMMGWMSLNHPAYQGLALEPGFQQALKDIEDIMAEQREHFRTLEAEGQP